MRKLLPFSKDDSRLIMGLAHKLARKIKLTTGVPYSEALKQGLKKAHETFKEASEINQAAKAWASNIEEVVRQAILKCNLNRLDLLKVLPYVPPKPINDHISAVESVISCHASFCLVERVNGKSRVKPNFAVFFHLNGGAIDNLTKTLVQASRTFSIQNLMNNL